MTMTITEKILAAHADLASVSPSQLINARIDISLGNDITEPIPPFMKQILEDGGLMGHIAKRS